jgi:hypothetical protein
MVSELLLREKRDLVYSVQIISARLKDKVEDSHVNHQCEG